MDESAGPGCPCPQGFQFPLNTTPTHACFLGARSHLPTRHRFRFTSMVSLSHSESVQSLLVRFRPVATPPAPTAVMVAGPAELTSPPTQGNEVVRYDPSSQHQTRSQQKRVAAADGGDLKERLNLIPIEAAEDGLRRRYCKHYPERSILEYLQQPGDGVAPHEAVTAVLEDLADETAETASGLALVYRYMQVHEMWRTHPDRTVRSAEDFVEYLDRAGYIRTGLVIGTAAQTAKRNSIRRIEARWGADWFHEVPTSIRDDRWRGPQDLSKNVLGRITTIAEQGRSLESAVQDWTEAIRQRNDMGARRKLDIKGKVTPYLVLADVAIADKGNPNGRTAGLASDLASDEAREERLQAEVVPRQPLTKSAGPKPDYTETPRPKTPKKRKRVPAAVPEQDGDGGPENDGWEKSANGRWMTKRVRNQIIRKPVEKADEPDDVHTTSQEDDDEHHTSSRPQTEASPVFISPSTTQPSPPAPTPHRSPRTPSSKTCAGPTFVRVLRELMKSFSELDDAEYVATTFCDCCRTSVTGAVDSITHEARKNMGQLNNVSKHLFGTTRVPARSEQLVSPERPRCWDTLFVTDDSDSDCGRSGVD